MLAARHARSILGHSLPRSILLSSTIAQIPIFTSKHQLTNTNTRLAFSTSNTITTTNTNTNINTKNIISVTVKEGGIALITLDAPDAKVNTLSAKLQEEFIQVLEKIQNDPEIKAGVLISGKKDGFIAGADIGMLSNCKTSQELHDLSAYGQKLLQTIEDGKPMVAAINGACLGGGLEVALACHYRIATQNPKTSLGLPEVNLGLLPGAGGTQRLPKLIGIPTALGMILAGSNANAIKAKKIKLVDEVVDERALESSALEAAREIVSGKLKINRKFGLIHRATEFAIRKIPFVRDAVLSKAKKQVDQKTNGKYPAPYEILKVIQEGISGGSKKGLEAEAEAFGRLGMTQVSKNLVHIFNGMTHSKKNVFGSVTQRINNIAVLGAGLMGAGITQVSIQKDIKVQLKDITAEAIARGEAQIYKNLDGAVKRKKFTTFERDRIMSNITRLTSEARDGDWKKHFANVELIVEAVPEDLNIKHKVIQEIEPHISKNTIFATNTSSLPIGDIAKASSRPENVIGMHYFSPVEKMPLLEIIPHAGTSKETCARTTDLGLRQGKNVIIVKDVAGFYVNRSLGPYMSETAALLASGVSPKELDTALTQFGFPVGPASLADEVGIDVAFHVQALLSKHLGDRMKGGDTDSLQELMEKKMLGRKTGKGFYLYPPEVKGQKKPSKELNPEATAILEKNIKSRLTLTQDEIQQRMITRFINEAAFCLQDEIIASPLDGDVGLVFGVGFPPFLGGPFRYIDNIGVDKFCDTMLRFRDLYGPQFTPAPILTQYAKEKKKFYPNN